MAKGVLRAESRPRSIKKSFEAISSQKREIGSLMVPVLVATALVVLWFRKDMILGTGESGLPFYDLSDTFDSVRYAWSKRALGAPVYVVMDAPFYFVLSCLRQIGVPAVWCQAFTVWLVLVVGSLSVHYLTLMAFDRQSHLTGTVASLFYMLNPFAMVNIWNRFQNTYIFFYGLIPAALYLYAKGLRLHKKSYAFYVNLVCLVFAGAWGSIPLVGTLWLVLLSYLFFHILSNFRRSEIFRAIGFSGLAFFLWILFNAWWLGLLAYITRFTSGIVGGASPGENLAILRGISDELGRMPFLISLLHRTFFEATGAPWRLVYLSTTFRAIGFLIPLLAFSTLLYRSLRKDIIYFAFLSALGLFLAKGVAPPLGEVFFWIFSHWTAFEVYRNPFEKFGIILPLGYAVLFSAGLNSLHSLLQRLTKKYASISSNGQWRRAHMGALSAKALVTLICFLVLGLYSWPMWTGAVYMGAMTPSSEIGFNVDVPEWYREANSWLSSQQTHSRLLALPIDGFGITYNWTYGYSGVELGNTLFSSVRCVSITTGIRHVDDIVLRLEKVLLNNAKSFWKVMAMLNVEYVVVRYDIDYVKENMRAPQEIASMLELTEQISYVKSFGKLDFYRLHNEYILPQIYALNQFLVVKDIDDMLFRLTPDDTFDPRDTMVLLRSQNATSKISLPQGFVAERPCVPLITFEKVNPSKYIVHVRNATFPFVLIFSETYHPEWKSSIDDDPTYDEYHFIANGYANGWFIDKKGSYEMVLEFELQRILYLGSVLSLTTFMVCAAVYGMEKTRKVFQSKMRHVRISS